MKKTPIKQATAKLQLCIVCAQTAKYPRKVEPTRTGAYKLDDNMTTRDLLLKYGGISVESGTICRSCWDKLSHLHKKTKAFYDLCQSNNAVRQMKLRGKRMASSVASPCPSVHKRQDLTKTPKSLSKGVSKIPTPISKTNSGVTRPNESSDEVSKQNTPIKTARRKRLYFGKAAETEKNRNEGAQMTISLDEVDNISVGMEIEIDLTGSELHDSRLNGSACLGETGKEDEKEIMGLDLGLISNDKYQTTSATVKQADHGYTKSIIGASKRSRSKNDSVAEQPIHHDYLKSQKKPPKFSSLYEEIRQFINEYGIEEETLSEKEALKLWIAFASRNVKYICETMLSIDAIKKCIIGLLMNQTDATASQMMTRKYSPSVLMQKSLSDLKAFDWFSVFEEMKSKFPELLALMLSLIIKREGRNLYTIMEKVVPRLGAVYGILMQGRNKELSLIQRLNSSVLLDNICDVKVFDRLQRQGLCLSHTGSVYMLDQIGGKFNDSVIELVRQRQRFRLIGDNINWTVGVHDQRIGHTAHMEHAFGSAILVQNLDFTSCVDDIPLRHYEETPCQDFIPTSEDIALYRNDYTVLMSRVVFQFLPYFQRFEDIIPVNLSQPCDDKLSLKTKVIPLPVLYKNEQKYQDVVGILEFYEKTVTEACHAAGRETNGLFIHIGGDQLTRERFSGAKVLRAHEDDPEERFENLSPITFEFFHMHMNFLALVFKTLYDEKSAQDVGTLKSLQNRISRSNVDKNVNTHYEADKDFFISVVDAHIVELFMEFFGMDDVNQSPSKNIPPVFQDNEQKKAWYFQTVAKLLDEIVSLKTTDKTPDNRPAADIEVEENVYEMVLADGRCISFCLYGENKEEKQHDGVYNYAKRVLEVGLHFKDLLDATKLPERNRHIRLLKQTMLLFKSHRNKSKYAYEILRLLVHQLCILSEKSANEEFYGMFVNTNGRFDSHIPADKQMEYLVKKVKEHIKHMFSKKTEMNVKRRSSAIAGIADICDRYDSLSNVIVRTHKHSDKSAHGDELILLDSLRNLRPFKKTHGRQHTTFANIASSLTESLDIQHYHEWITTRKHKFATELGN